MNGSTTLASYVLYISSGVCIFTTFSYVDITRPFFVYVNYRGSTTMQFLQTQTNIV